MLNFPEPSVLPTEVFLVAELVNKTSAPFNGLSLKLVTLTLTVAAAAGCLEFCEKPPKQVDRIRTVKNGYFMF